MLDTSPAPVGTGTGRPVASYRTNLVTALLGIWFTVGLMIDAGAHNNVPGLERSEERGGGKEGRSRRAPYHYKKTDAVLVDLLADPHEKDRAHGHRDDGREE